MLFALELLLSFWAALMVYGLVGFGWASFCLEGRLERLAFAPLLGWALHLLVILNANYLGFTADKTLGAQLLLTAGVGALGYLALLPKARLKRTESRFKGLKNFAPLALLVSLVFFAGVSPLVFLLHRLGSLNYFLGDFFAYWSLAHWLQAHSFGCGTGFHPALNLCASYGFEYMAEGQRVGAPLWLGWLSALFRLQPDELFSILAAFLMALEAAAVYLLADLALGGKRRWVAFAAALFFALHPLTLWSAFSAYLPQHAGTALGLGVFYACLRPWKNPLRLGVLAGVLAAALYGAYVEIAPVLLVICALAVLFRVARAEVTWGGLGRFLAGGLCAFVPATWVTFAYNTRGLFYQLTTKWSCGPMQSSAGWVLGGLFLGFTPIPIELAAVRLLPRVECFFIMAAVALTAAVVLRQWKRLPLRAALWALSAAFAALMLFVGLRYAFEPRQLSWDLFKVVNYAVPFLFFFVPLAFFSLGKKWRLLWLVFLVPYGFGEFCRWSDIASHAHFTAPDRSSQMLARARVLQGLSGDFYLAQWPADEDIYNNFRPLLDRNFILENRPCTPSGYAAYHIAFEGDSGARKGFFNDPRRPDRGIRLVYPDGGHPVSYVVANPGAFFPGRVLYRDDRCQIVDVRGQLLVLPMVDEPSGEKNFYLSCPGLPAAARRRSAELTILCLRAQPLRFRVSQQISGGQNLERSETFTVKAAAGATPLSLPLDKFDSGAGLLVRVTMADPCPLRILNIKDFKLPVAGESGVPPPALLSVDTARQSLTALGWWPSAGCCYNICYGKEPGKYTNDRTCTGLDAEHGGLFNIPPGRWHFAVRAAKDGKFSAFSADMPVEIRADEGL